MLLSGQKEWNLILQDIQYTVMEPDIQYTVKKKLDTEIGIITMQQLHCKIF